MVSIIVPSYGHERFLPACIESVLAQTSADWELLILDDCGPDGSRAIAEAYAQKDSRIRSLPNPQNLGTYSTQNRGLDFAKGEWIAILNSDDLWRPEKLAAQMSLLARHPELDSCYCLGELVDESGSPLQGDDHHDDCPREEVQDLLPYLLDRNQVLASGLVFRKGAIRFEDGYGACGDWVAMLRLALVGPIGFVGQPLVGWRQHGANTSQGLTHIREQIAVRRAIEQLAPSWKETRADEPWNTKRDLNALALAADLTTIGEMKEARAVLSRPCLSTRPETQTTWRNRKLLVTLPYPIARLRISPDHHESAFARSAPKREPVF